MPDPANRYNYSGRHGGSFKGDAILPDDTQNRTPVPGVFTAAFHRDFLLPLLVRSLGTKEPLGRSGFENHVPLELPVLFVISVVAVVIGLPAWQTHGSVIGGLAALAGAFVVI